MFSRDFSYNETFCASHVFGIFNERATGDNLTRA